MESWNILPHPLLIDGSHAGAAAALACARDTVPERARSAVSGAVELRRQPRSPVETASVGFFQFVPATPDRFFGSARFAAARTERDWPSGSKS